MLLTHRENVAWQNVEECTWHSVLVWVALRLMPRIVVDHLVRPDVTFGHFPLAGHFCDGHAVVTSNAVAAIGPVNDGLLYAIPVTRSCAAAMNVCHCVRCDWG